jgi:hypothetical protein
VGSDVSSLCDVSFVFFHLMGVGVGVGVGGWVDLVEPIKSNQINRSELI